MAAIANAHQSTASALLSLLAKPFTAIGRGLVFLSEAQSKKHELDRLSRTSDEQLIARGLTRDSEIRRILGVSFYL